MTEPIGFNPSLNYTPYDPDLESCQTGAHESSNGGAEGTGGTPNVPPAAQSPQDCDAEALKVVAACGSAILATKFSPPPVALFAWINCVANVMDAVECVPEPKTQGQ